MNIANIYDILKEVETPQEASVNLTSNVNKSEQPKAVTTSKAEESSIINKIKANPETLKLYENIKIYRASGTLK